MKRIKKILAIFLVAILSLALVACGNKESNDNKGFTIVDSNGREVTFEKTPERVVSIAPGITETIFELGKGDTLVGRSDYCDYPEEALNVEAVGSLTKPNIEKIVELNPDVVIGAAHFPEEAVTKLEELGVKVVILYGEDNYEGAYENIENLGKLLNVQDKANEVIDGMKKKVAEVEEKVKGLSKPSVYYVVGFGKKDSAPGGDTFISQLIEMAGGDNISKDVNGWTYSLEKIVEHDPEIIIVSDQRNSKQLFMEDDAYKNLTAVKEGRVYEIDHNTLSRQGYRQAEGLEALAKIIHPEAFK